ncbi:flagellar filament capping protein FliD [Pseudoalteromonas aurantia]|uniref:Flagellar hook-associated protein 2 n=1 Tax=Pseudoalteromonas aurantia TaxID=43654 RepID=A0A5S3VC61_9GAMM|nr:flagellar filament capping protein FliD [Pseudoalteromonas aurantia]TMO69477.1 flagellar cap protein [Pseudoalteromonas aurantia]
MPLITSAGIGSGLDLESIISASVDAENRPKIEAFATKEESLKVELSSLGEIKSALSKLQDTIEKLADPTNFNKRSASITQPTVGDGDLITATPSSSSTPGNFTVEVLSTAQGSKAVSADSVPPVFTASDNVVTASGGGMTFEAGGKSFDITLEAGATLQDLRNAVNNADTNFGISANIINTGSESKLVFTSNITGAGNDLTITNDTAELDAVSTQAFGGAAGSGGMVIAAADQATDASIIVDGITITNDSNTFTDAVEGMTIVAKRESVDNETARLNVEYDRTGATELIDELIANYNNAVGQIGLQSRIGKPLNSDATLRSLSAQLVNTLSSTVEGAEPFETVFDIGLGVDKEGYLEKTSLVRSLNEAMDDNFDDIGKLFAGDNGVATKIQTLLENYTESDGIIKDREDNLNVQLEDLTDDVVNHQYRMQELEAGLRKKYSGLDVLLAQMQSTQSYLGAQLANLPGFTTKK